MDNNIVTIVTTLHTPNESVLSVRKKPHATSTNKGHLERVWGPDYEKAVQIPRTIDDYNHYMLGCDRADQLISNYRLKLRCRRIWMPIMFHSLDLLRTNAFVAHSNIVDKSEKLEHKDFILAMVDKFCEQVTALSVGATRSQHEKEKETPTTISPSKRRRISVKRPVLPTERFEGKPTEHSQTIDEKRSTCRYCSYVKVCHKVNNMAGPPPKVRNIYRMCSYCQVYLCQEHFDVYHRDQLDETTDSE